MTLHLRFDDSRPRHLASVCSCGEPGCLEWHWEAIAIANRLLNMSTPERGAAPGAFLRLDVPPSTLTLSDVKPDPDARLGAAGRLSTKRGRSA